MSLLLLLLIIILQYFFITRTRGTAGGGVLGVRRLGRLGRGRTAAGRAGGVRPGQRERGRGRRRRRVHAVQCVCARPDCAHAAHRECTRPARTRTAGEECGLVDSNYNDLANNNNMDYMMKSSSACGAVSTRPVRTRGAHAWCVHTPTTSSTRGARLGAHVRVECVHARTVTDGTPECDQIWPNAARAGPDQGQMAQGAASGGLGRAFCDVQRTAARAGCSPGKKVRHGGVRMSLPHTHTHTHTHAHVCTRCTLCACRV
jgi:hypothetical protein